MIKYLIKDTVEVRVEDEDAADALHKQMAAEAENIGATLVTWNESIKTRKSGGEIVDSWVIVKYTLVFNDAKEPETVLKSIEYNMANYEIDEIPFDEAPSAF